MVIRITLMMRWKDLGISYGTLRKFLYRKFLQGRDYLLTIKGGLIRVGFQNSKDLDYDDQLSRRITYWCVRFETTHSSEKYGSSAVEAFREHACDPQSSSVVWNVFVPPGWGDFLKWNSDRLRLRSWTLNKSRKLSLYFEETLNYFSSWNKFIFKHCVVSPR